MTGEANTGADAFHCPACHRRWCRGECVVEKKEAA